MASPSLPATMRAIIHTQSTQTLALSNNEPLPDLPAGEYLLKNEAAGITNGELFWPRPPELDRSYPCVEAAGVIVQAPSRGKFKPGDKVYHRVVYPRGGGAREYSTVTEDVLALRPESISAEEAASIPVSALTAWQGLFEQANLEPNFDTTSHPPKSQRPQIFINGASGGAGNWYVQLAHAAGYYVVATCSTKNIELVRSLGADEVLDYTKTPLAEYFTTHPKYPLVFDNVGGKSLLAAWHAVAPGGKLFTIAPPGEISDFVNWKYELEPPNDKGVSEGVEGRFFLMRADGAQLGRVTELVEEGRCRGVVDGVWGMGEFEGAFGRVGSGRAVGRVVIRKPTLEMTRQADEEGMDADSFDTLMDMMKQAADMSKVSGIKSERLAEEGKDVEKARLAFVAAARGLQRRPTPSGDTLMHFEELLLDTHHRGRYVLVRVVEEPKFQPSRAITIVQDAHKQAEFVILEHGQHQLDSRVLPKGGFLAIKEPYYTVETDLQTWYIRVDHPSDIVQLSPQSAMYLLPFASGYHQAAYCYTEGLASVGENVELKLDLLRNRAYANLELGYYDSAERDARASVSSGRVAITDRDNSDAEQLLARVSARQQEQSSGTYDFEAMIEGLDSCPRIDAADFVKQTEVKASPGRSRGLFATEDIEEGEIILVEKAAHIMFDNDSDFYLAFNYDSTSDQIYRDQGALLQNIVRELDRNPSRLGEILDLFDNNYAKDPSEGTEFDGKTIIDVFHIRQLMIHNLYTCATPSTAQKRRMLGFVSYSGIQNAGIWPRANMMNHSCVQNVRRSHIGDLLILRAARRIEKGAELFSVYREDFDFEQRQSVLSLRWGIICSCAVCTAERSQTPQVRRRRGELVAKYNSLVKPSGMIVDGQLLEDNTEAVLRIYLDLDKTYEPAFQGLPELIA
ncbi:hypothetical protein M409DRAFT_57821 [Zasmidium cellare ATCC 36951]|uniref:SET domain-containing protein n=1 Tax=Zasmidium cellare ATCC 36951 TaxID=1080233 RepID=A0A6A6CAA4_ZASCE|nr:uncharacterized protein M409DRAFT_57821 [Zasmidium cellare ATCC 36951]KAF2163158.1 hypothetical protein M409DRAFT_57821 [Zasmidium cellare ATCC 36951]